MTFDPPQNGSHLTTRCSSRPSSNPFLIAKQPSQRHHTCVVKRSCRACVEGLLCKDCCAHWMKHGPSFPKTTFVKSGESEMLAPQKCQGKKLIFHDSGQMTKIPKPELRGHTSCFLPALPLPNCQESTNLN